MDTVCLHDKACQSTVAVALFRSVQMECISQACHHGAFVLGGVTLGHQIDKRQVDCSARLRSGQGKNVVEEIPTVGALPKALDGAFDLIAPDEAFVEGDLLRAANLYTLALLKRRHEFCGV